MRERTEAAHQSMLREAEAYFRFKRQCIEQFETLYGEGKTDNEIVDILSTKDNRCQRMWVEDWRRENKLTANKVRKMTAEEILDRNFMRNIREYDRE